MTEITVSAKNVDAAIALGAEKLGKSVDEVKYEVIEEGKKGMPPPFDTSLKVHSLCSV